MYYTETLGHNSRTAEQINTDMGRVYGHMMLALLTSALVAWWCSGSIAYRELMQGTSLLKWVVVFAPLIAVLAVTFTINSVGKVAAFLMLHGFATLMAFSTGHVIGSFTAGSVVSAFVGAAIMFAVVSGWGYFTRQSLDSIGKWAFAGLIAIIIASLINIWIGSTVLQTVLSILSICVFLMLTAWDTQNIRERLMESNSGNEVIVGALSLYLNLVNIFLNLLGLTGDRE